MTPTSSEPESTAAATSMAQHEALSQPHGPCHQPAESAEMDCPPVAALDGVVPSRAYSAFTAGWSAGIFRRTAHPASAELIDDVATMLDAVHVADSLTARE